MSVLKVLILRSYDGTKFSMIWRLEVTCAGIEFYRSSGRVDIIVWLMKIHNDEKRHFHGGSIS